MTCPDRGRPFGVIASEAKQSRLYEQRGRRVAAPLAMTPAAIVGSIRLRAALPHNQPNLRRTGTLLVSPGVERHEIAGKPAPTGADRAAEPGGPSSTSTLVVSSGTGRAAEPDAAL